MRMGPDEQDFAERSPRGQNRSGGLSWWMGIEATAVWTLWTAAGPGSGEDVRVALLRHLLSLCCLFVFSLFPALPAPALRFSTAVPRR